MFITSSSSSFYRKQKEKELMTKRVETRVRNEWAVITQHQEGAVISKDEGKKKSIRIISLSSFAFAQYFLTPRF